MKTSTIDYQDEGIALEGYYAYDDSNTTKRPLVLVCHDWTGRNPFACDKANRLAELGYVGFALDMYGKGKLGNTKEEKSALMTPFMQHRPGLLKRMQAGINAACQLPMVDAKRIAAIGFCFGGLCVLDLARSGANVCGVVSFHGLFIPPEVSKQTPILAKILALHGYDDPMANHEALLGFANEMTAAHANFEVDVYGGTLHAFTNPEANDPGFGTVYNKQADSRSWQRLVSFLAEIFNEGLA